MAYPGRDHAGVTDSRGQGKGRGWTASPMGNAHTAGIRMSTEHLFPVSQPGQPPYGITCRWPRRARRHFDSAI
jgi:hypothetical protein